MDLLAIFTKTDQLPVKSPIDSILPEEEFSDYVSRAVDQARSAEDNTSKAGLATDAHAADRRDRAMFDDDTHDDEADRLTRKAEEQSRLQEEHAAQKDQTTENKPSDKADASPASQDDSSTDDGEQAADDEAEPDEAAGSSPSSGAPAVADAPTPPANIMVAAVTGQLAETAAGSRPVQSATQSKSAAGQTEGAAGQIKGADGNPKGLSGTPPAPAASDPAHQNKGKQGPAPRAGEIAQRVHEALATKSEPGNPGLQAALAEVLGKGNGLRIATATTGTGEHRPLINTSMLAATGMEATSGKDGIAPSNPVSGSGQQANHAVLGAQAAATSHNAARVTAGISDAPVPAGSTGEITGGASGGKALSTFSGTAGGSETVQLGHSLETTGSASLPRASAPHAATITHQVSVQISKAIGAGHDRISIQLDPAELGRIDVKLEISGDGRVVARVTADRAETLDMLQRDYRGLERALQQSGLQTDSNSLNFSLRQGGHGESGNNTGGGSQGGSDETPLAQTNETPDASSSDRDYTAGNGRLDIQV